MRRPYPSDLTDDQWLFLEPLLPPAKPGGRPRTVNLREVIHTIFYVNRAGCIWAMIPHDLVPRSTAFRYFSCWRDDGTWARILEALRRQVRVSEGREPTPSVSSTSERHRTQRNLYG